MANIGRRLRAERQARSLTQEALARRADVSLNLVNQLERGVTTDPHYSTLVRLAGALGMFVAELVGEESPKVEAPLSSEQQRERRRGARFERLSLEERRRVQAQAEAMWESLGLDIPKKLRELAEEMEVVRSVVVDHPVLTKRREAEQSIDKVEHGLHKLEEDLGFGAAG